MPFSPLIPSSQSRQKNDIKYLSEGLAGLIRRVRSTLKKDQLPVIEEGDENAKEQGTGTTQTRISLQKNTLLRNSTSSNKDTFQLKKAKVDRSKYELF